MDVSYLAKQLENSLVVSRSLNHLLGTPGAAVMCAIIIIRAPFILPQSSRKLSPAVPPQGVGVGPGRLDSDHDSQDQGQAKGGSVELHFQICWDGGFDLQRNRAKDGSS